MIEEVRGKDIFMRKVKSMVEIEEEKVQVEKVTKEYALIINAEKHLDTLSK